MKTIFPPIVAKIPNVDTLIEKGELYLIHLIEPEDVPKGLPNLPPYIGLLLQNDTIIMYHKPDWELWGWRTPSYYR